jgi:hypothetical protein
MLWQCLCEAQTSTAMHADRPPPPPPSTPSPNTQTEDIIIQTIRSKFADKTVITIAHRYVTAA